MGINGMIMVLLSTLAALVIIVHTEEELSRGVDREVFGYDTPEVDTGTLDRRWRVARNEPDWSQPDAEPIIQSTPLDIWADSPEVPRRRRLGRKRKRPPMEKLHEDEIPQATIAEQSYETHAAPTLPRYNDYDDFKYRQTHYDSDTPRRRRKPDGRRNRWTEEYSDVERPIRRQRPRKKRPQAPSDSTEFNEFVPRDETQEAEYQPVYKANDDKFEVLHKETVNAEDDENSNNRYHGHTNVNEHAELFNFREDSEPQLDYNTKESRIQETISHPSNTEPKNKPKQDLSEISEEYNNPIINHNEEHNIQQKDQLKESDVKSIPMKQKPIDPIALKELLKRSNGSSLSEILQQNNLSLSDLLRGKEDALSVLKAKESVNKQSAEDKEILNLEVEDEKEKQRDKQIYPQGKTENDSAEGHQANPGKEADLELQSTGSDRKSKTQENVEEKENRPKIATKRRFPQVRRKLRMRAPAMNGTYKNPLSRDLIEKTARKYYHMRNMTKTKQWKDVLPLMNSSDSSSEEINKNNEATELLPTTTSIPEETTILHNSEYYNPSTVTAEPDHIVKGTTKQDDEEENVDRDTTTSIPVTEEIMTTEIATTTEKPKVSRLRPPGNRAGSRRQAFNNRMKRKRMKHKTSTTEAPSNQEDNVDLLGIQQDNVDLMGMPNLVSSSEFIARTQTPQTPKLDNQEDDFTTLDDFFTTEKVKITENGPRYTRNSTIPALESETTRAPTIYRYSSTTEETAKFEIEEILNDTRTSARLSKILMERNMTLNELVEHRERGSSHVHLADIFHNASKEPNPPEPFLSKSLIEPISKETYPLRAILEANLHEAAAKATTVEPIINQPHYVNIPVAMNFGNNVNENGENMGIMSLFNKIKENDISSVEMSATGKDSEETPYVTTIFAVNHTEINDTAREGKSIGDKENNLKNDIVGWSHLFELMRRSQKNNSSDNATANDSSESSSKEVLDEEKADDILIFDNLQRMKTKTVPKQNIDIHSYEITETSIPGILNTPPSKTKSVTVAVASIVGLAMILFLLTYAAIKWKQQRNMIRQKEGLNERIPTPVFENRKGHKNNSSTRSISPMLNSNIYTTSTLDSSHGKESPEYMWDSLTKPFQ